MLDPKTTLETIERFNEIDEIAKEIAEMWMQGEYPDYISYEGIDTSSPIDTDFITAYGEDQYGDGWSIDIPLRFLFLPRSEWKAAIAAEKERKRDAYEARRKKELERKEKQELERLRARLAQLEAKHGGE